MLLASVVLGDISPGVAAQVVAPGLEPRPPTPVLIEQAVGAGGLTRALGDLFLARALGGRNQYVTIPAEFQSTTRWDGTVPLLNLRRRTEAMAAGPDRSAIEEVLSPPEAANRAAAPSESLTCGTNTITTAAVVDSSYFHILGSPFGTALTATDYGAALDTARSTQVDAFGWPAPPFMSSAPPPGGRYPVAILPLGGGLFGYTDTRGTYSGSVGDNPNTAWNDTDAAATCIVLRDDFSQFGDARNALNATAAHEYNHAIQFGYGALAGTNVPDASFIEGGATWMEDEVYDTSNDGYDYLWPDFTQSLGDYDASPYAFWLMIRGLTERFGAGIPAGAEQVMQDFWEETSKGTGNNVSALATAVSRRGLTLAAAFHDFAIAAAFMRSCGGSYVVPLCFEEAGGYLARTSGVLPPVQGAISALGSTFTGSVEDDYATSWITLPTGAGFTGYTLKFTNTSAGGQLRATAVCDTGTDLVSFPFPLVAAGVASTRTPVTTTGCVRALAVVTNETQSAGNPDASGARSFTLTAQAGPPGPPTGVTATAGNASATVSWAAPAVNGGAPVTGYTATSSPDAKTCATTGALSCTISALTPGTPYSFTVVATNSGGTGMASAPSNQVSPYTVPGPPTGVSATVENGSSTVAWSAPASNGGSPILGYVATASPGGWTCSTTAALRCAVTGLANGTPYTFTVSAQNIAGSGTPSAPSAAVTPDSTLPQGQRTWWTRAPMPTPRDTLATAAGKDGKIYAIGGYWSRSTPVFVDTYYDSIEAYDPVTNTWVTRTPMPTARRFLGAATGPDGTIYAIGGRVGLAFYLGTVESYNPATDSWTTKASMPTARIGLAVVAGSNGKIYAIGGLTSSGPVATVEQYDPATNSWSTRAPMSTPRNEKVAATSGPDGKIYVMGGGTAVVEAYDPVSNTWAVKSPLPTGIEPEAAVASDSRVYVIANRRLAAYDPATDAWSSRFDDPDLPTPRGDFAASTGTDGKFYTVGGRTSGYSSVVEAYVPRPGTTTTVSAPATGTVGQPVAMSAKVAGNAGVPAGTLTFLIDGQVLSDDCGFIPVDGTGAAACSYIFTTAGPHQIRATFAPFPGLPEYFSSASGTVTVTVAPVGPGKPRLARVEPGNASLDVLWYAQVDDTGGSPVTGYTATASPGGKTCSATGTSCTIGGLTNNTPYTVTLTATNSVGTSPPSNPYWAVIPRLPLADFDGDGVTDFSVFRPSSNTWFVWEGLSTAFGAGGDIPVPCDYDGNGTTDIAVFRPAVGGWFIKDQPTVFLGANGDIPVPGDYDGDGRCDAAVFRPSVGGWYRNGGATVFFGLNGDVPVPADYDGNGITDIAIFRPSVGGWYRNGAATVFFGLNGDIPVPADYDGNGGFDVGVYRPSVGGWYVSGQTTVFRGLNGDVPAPADYDGNALADRVVFRPGTGAWYIGNNPIYFGLNGDRPLPLPSAIRQAFFP